MRLLLPCIAFCGTFEKKQHIGQNFMARDSAAGLPPYFNIDPDQALAELDPPTGTEGFARIAGACARR